MKKYNYMKNSIYTNIIRLKTIDNDIKLFLDNLQELGDVIVFGGAVRDYYYNQFPRDIDIVINTKADEVSTFMNKYCHIKNRYGGYKLNINSTLFDIWPLESTWAFKNNILKCSIDNLTKTVFFNADSIAINLSGNELYEDGFYEAINRKLLKIVLDKNPYPALCILRAYYFKERKSFKFSNELCLYINDWLRDEENPINELFNIQIQHYGYNMFSKNQLYDFIKPFI